MLSVYVITNTPRGSSIMIHHPSSSLKPLRLDVVGLDRKAGMGAEDPDKPRFAHGSLLASD